MLSVSLFNIKSKLILAREYLSCKMLNAFQDTSSDYQLASFRSLILLQTSVCARAHGRYARFGSESIYTWSKELKYILDAALMESWQCTLVKAQTNSKRRKTEELTIKVLVKEKGCCSVFSQSYSFREYLHVKGTKLESRNAPLLSGHPSPSTVVTSRIKNEKKF